MNKEIRISLDDNSFTNLCKRGSVQYKVNMFNIIDIAITTKDMLQLIDGNIIEKNNDNLDIKIALQDLGHDHIFDIVRRSPIYGNIV